MQNTPADPPRSVATAHFQPIVDLTAWRVTGFEALARFHDGQGPLVHLNRAKLENRTTELELELLNNAVLEANYLPQGFCVALNISAQTLFSPLLGAILKQGNGHPVGLEMLETSADTEDSERMRARIEELGCKLLVDDAGSGHSDEERILNLRPQTVKIDRCLFNSAARDAAARELLDRLIRVSREIGAWVLIEGIETLDHLNLAREVHADFAQGFYFGRALPHSDIPAHLTQLHDRLGVEFAVA